jgi:hypothetical protein
VVDGVTNFVICFLQARVYRYCSGLSPHLKGFLGDGDFELENGRFDPDEIFAGPVSRGRTAECDICTIVDKVGSMMWLV